VITAGTKEVAEKARELVSGYMAERGLQLSEEKTLITNITEGFDFLGWNFRRYSNGKLLIKPSKKSQQKVLQKIREIIQNNKSAKQDSLIALLNPVIDGWSAYHQGAISGKIFHRIDHLTYQKLWRWARRRHRDKGRHWTKDRYWHIVDNDHWIFKDTLTLRRMGDKKVTRHIPLKRIMNPYIDTDYFHNRRITLLVNRKLGHNPGALRYTLTDTGKSPDETCLIEA
jgi:RNA-directed DNA polymerase